MCVAAFLLGACGDDDNGLICGAGTLEVDGECVANSSDAGADLGSPADRRLCNSIYGPVENGALLVDVAYTGADSDGSSERPFADIQAAIDAASAGQEIGIAAGTYTGDLSIDSSLRLEGRCANDVIVEGGIHVQNTSDVAIRGLTVQNGTPGILAANVQPAGDDEFGLKLQFVRATRNNGSGLEINASAVEILDSEFSFTEASGEDIRQLGSGIFVNDGSRFDIRNSFVEMNGFIGIDVADATGLPLQLVEDPIFEATPTLPSSGFVEMNGIIGNEGGGVRVGGAPSGILAPFDAPLVEILGNDFVDNDGDAIQVFSARANVVGNSLTGVPSAQSGAGIRGEVITGIIGNNQITSFAEGAMLLNDSQGLAISNNTLTDNLDVGILSFNNRGISLSGNVVQGTKDATGGGTGHGVYISSDGNINNVGAHELTSNTVSDNEGVGIVIRDLDIGDNAERFVTMFSNTVARNALMGIDIDNTRAVGMFDNALIDNVGYGLRCIDGPGAASRVFFDDNVLTGTLASGSGLDGDGILASNCHISIDLNTIQENARNGIVLVSGTDGGCDFNDVTGHAANGAGVFDIRVNASPGMSFQGNALAVQGVAADSTDLNLERSAAPGI